jgi:magnesium chelatase family protein
VVDVIARAVTFTLSGLEARRIDVEAHLRTQTSPSFAVVGLPDRAVSEARQRVRSAVRSSQYEFPGHELTVNLAPAREKKQGSGFDLAIGLAVLAVSGQAPAERIERVAAAAELGLDGRLRPVAGVLAMAEAAAQLELDCILVAPENAAEASLVPGIAVAAVADLNQAVGVLEGWAEAEPPAPAGPPPLTAHPDMADVCGQARARRAVEIAAAGGHNLLLCGPPGSGKTMLARRLPGLLPPPDPAESLAISRIHSAAGLLAGGRAMLERPFRAPHHSASMAALVGSASLRPGEVTLAHGGVLFLDELPEFQRPALEALRLPLEDGEVLISRAAGAVRMPARSLVVAAMNPCPCGPTATPTVPASARPSGSTPTGHGSVGRCSIASTSASMCPEQRLTVLLERPRPRSPPVWPGPASGWAVRLRRSQRARVGCYAGRSISGTCRRAARPAVPAWPGPSPPWPGRMRSPRNTWLRRSRTAPVPAGDPRQADRPRPGGIP